MESTESENAELQNVGRVSPDISSQKMWENFEYELLGYDAELEEEDNENNFAEIINDDAENDDIIIQGSSTDEISSPESSPSNTYALFLKTII